MYSKNTILLKTPVKTTAYTKIRIDNHRSDVTSCEFHKNGRFLLSSNSDGEIQIYRTNHTFQMLAHLRGHEDEVTEVHYSKDGASVFSSSMDRTIGIWDTFTGTRKRAIFAHNRPVNTIQCSPADGNMFCSGSADRKIRVWDIRQEDCTAMLTSHHGVSSACFSACGKYIFNGGFWNGDIVSWDIRQKNIVHVLGGHSGAVTGLAVSPTGRYLGSISVDGTLRKWELSALEEPEEETEAFKVGPSDLNLLRRCAWSRNDRMLAAGNSKNNIIVVDTFYGEVLTELDGHKDVVTDVAFHPRRRMVMSAGADTYLFLHNV